MAETFLHGVEVLEIDAGPRPIQTVRSSVIGIVGTAPRADETAFPLNTPVMIAGNRREAAKLLANPGADNGTLPSAIDSIFDQAGAVIVTHEAGFDVAAPLFWEDCEDDLNPATVYWDGSGFVAIPVEPEVEQSTVTINPGDPGEIPSTTA